LVPVWFPLKVRVQPIINMDFDNNKEIYPACFPSGVKEERITFAHGAGGKRMHRLIREIFLKYFGNKFLNRMEDSAVIRVNEKEMCFTTDSYVVKPIFFPGGDIGKLAVCGTVNDLAVMGAVPKYISCSFVIREGFSFEKLELICSSISRTAKKAGVVIVTGDAKVIEGNGEDEIYINTSGVGVRRNVKLGVEFVKPGDLILINGGIGEHEAAVAVARGDYRLTTRLKSDCSSLNRMIDVVIKNKGVRVMRDPTRGGLATTLNEFAEGCGLGFVIDDVKIPIKWRVRGVANILGLDPFYMANEGKVVVVCDRRGADDVIAAMRRFPEGKKARVIGEVVKTLQGVWLKTQLGTLRRLLMLDGEQLPRIC